MYLQDYRHATGRHASTLANSADGNLVAPLEAAGTQARSKAAISPPTGIQSMRTFILSCAVL